MRDNEIYEIQKKTEISNITSPIYCPWSVSPGQFSWQSIDKKNISDFIGVDEIMSILETLSRIHATFVDA